MFETRAGIFLIAGFGFFILAFIVMAWVPIAIYQGEPELSVQELAKQGVTFDFVDLAERYPKQFKEHFGEVSEESYAEALALGHKVYIGEACWHCHSQFVRPVSNEGRRWNGESYATEYQNEFQRPVLFGTRRVGPDLIREGSRKSNDWHVAHFYKPTSVAPVSVMPRYPWFFDDEGYPNKKGFAIITYVQWLGSWHQNYPYWYNRGPGLPAKAPVPPPGFEPTVDDAATDGGVAMTDRAASGKGV